MTSRGLSRKAFLVEGRVCAKAQAYESMKWRWRAASTLEAPASILGKGLTGWSWEHGLEWRSDHFRDLGVWQRPRCRGEAMRVGYSQGGRGRLIAEF